MNQEKIGALIASLRKKQGLTQSELGAKVGVGDRAVSKWERGITCPDISIINELSSILGITSDELLKGELNKEHKEQFKKTKFNKKLLLLIPLLLIIIILSIIISNNNKTYAYTLRSDSPEYDVAGKIIFNKDKTNIIINSIAFNDKKNNEIIIKNYEYIIQNNKDLILRNGYIDDVEFFGELMTIKEYLKSLKINYSYDTKIDRQSFLRDGITIEFNFLTEDDKIITKIISISLGK